MADRQVIATIDFSVDNDLSDEVIISPDVIVGLYVPTIDAAAVYIQAATESGGTFARIQTIDGTGDYTVASSTGGKCLFLDIVAPFTYLKVETSAAQTADREFVFVLKNREKVVNGIIDDKTSYQA